MLVDFVALLLEFLFTLVFGLLLSALVITLAIRSPSRRMPNEPGEKDRKDPGLDMDDLVEMIEKDRELFKPSPLAAVPHLALAGAKLGGGAGNELCSKASGTIEWKLIEDPNERRKYNRRLGDRRRAEQLVPDERRLIQRRVWLRRAEDRRGKTLLTVADAAATLGVPVEQMYKWLDESDIPFYQVTEGKRKAIRFEIGELLQWHRAFVTSSRNPKQET
jgi:excisionase family DNA binding protein